MAGLAREREGSETAEPRPSATGGPASSGDGSRGRGYDAVLEDRFEVLNLHGEEEEELDLSGEIDGLIAETRWIAIFKVHTQKPFSHVSLFKSM